MRDVIEAPARSGVLGQVAARIPAPVTDGYIRMGIDGADGSGKTMFADELARIVRAAGRQVLRVCADEFHNVRAVR